MSSTPLTPIDQDRANFRAAVIECGLSEEYATETNIAKTREYLVGKYTGVKPGDLFSKEWYRDGLLDLKNIQGGLEAPPIAPVSRHGIIWDKDEDGLGSKEELAKHNREVSDRYIAESGPINQQARKVARHDLDGIMILENRGITNPAQQAERLRCEQILGINQSGGQGFDEKVFVYRDTVGRGNIVDWAKTEAKRAENKAKNAAARGGNG